MKISIELSEIIIAIVNFLILYFVLKKVLFDPLIKKMNERNENIKKTIKDNNDKKNLLDGLRQQYTTAIKTQEVMKQQIIDKYKQKGSIEYIKVLQKAKKQAQNIQDKAIVEAKEEKNKALQDAKKDIGKLSVLIASKVTNENIDNSKNNELADRFVKEVDIK